MEGGLNMKDMLVLGGVDFLRIDSSSVSLLDVSLPNGAVREATSSSFSNARSRAMETPALYK